MASPKVKRAIKLFGTETEDSKPKELRAGPIAAMLDNGALRYVKLDGIDVLLAIAFLVRDENWGTYLLTIGDGRFGGSGCPHATTCSNRQPGVFGDVAVHGNRITFTPAGEPGHWSYYWSVYRDRLTFRRIPGNTDNPTGFIVKPYRRWTR